MARSWQEVRAFGLHLPRADERTTAVETVLTVDGHVFLRWRPADGAVEVLCAHGDETGGETGGPAGDAEETPAHPTGRILRLRLDDTVLDDETEELITASWRIAGGMP